MILLHYVINRFKHCILSYLPVGLSPMTMIIVPKQTVIDHLHFLSLGFDYYKE